MTIRTNKLCVFCRNILIVGSDPVKSAQHVAGIRILDVSRPPLNDVRKKSTVAGRSRPTIFTVSKVGDLEQTPEMKKKALRLFCRAMIRLYLRDHGDSELGNRMGVL